MEASYAKKKNAELEDLLKARSLPHTGKKAELVARLVQYDKEHSSDPTTTAAPSQPAGTTTGADDEIDWDDDTPSTGQAVPTKAPSDTNAGSAVTSTAIPNQAAATDPSKTADLTIAGAMADSKKPMAGPPGFEAHLPSSNVDDELVKRAKRAAKFGVVSTDADEATKKLERAKKFGGGGTEGVDAIACLDRALPEREERRKRGRGEEDSGRGTKRVDSRKREGGKKSEGGEVGKKHVAGVAGSNEKDRLAAEERKKRFAAQAVA